MGNTLPQLNNSRSSADESNASSLKKSRSLRDYTRSVSMPTGENTRKSISFPRPKSSAPNDAEIIDIAAPRSDPTESKNPLTSIDFDEEKFYQRIQYIQSCVRKEKGLLGMMTENIQSKHIFSHNEPENTHTLERNPNDYHMDYQQFYLKTVDGEFIHSYWIYQPAAVTPTSTLLYLHGAGGNISHRLEVLRLFYDNLHCNILIIDYRGFGKSTGAPTELGLYIDAQTAYDYLVYKRRIPPEDIIVFGTSLGASVAIQLVSDPSNRSKVAIFENAFISVPEIAKYFVAYAKNVIGLTKSAGFVYLFDNSSKVGRIQCPCLYLTGLLDPIIPTWMSNTLYEETKAAKKRHIFEYPFGRHNDLPIMPEYFDNIQSFLNELPISNDAIQSTTAVR